MPWWTTKRETIKIHLPSTATALLQQQQSAAAPPNNCVSENMLIGTVHGTTFIIFGARAFQPMEHVAPRHVLLVLLYHVNPLVPQFRWKKHVSSLLLAV